MLLFVILSLVNGLLTTLNKMLNLEATHSLGTTNGTLINYIEGTILSLIAVFVMGKMHLIYFDYWGHIPPITLMGGIFGLIATLFAMVGMAKVRISYSTVILLVGQLGAGFFVDAIIAGKVIPLKILGIILVAFGIFLDQIVSGKWKQKASSENSVK
ncbi:MAG TPA: hypothetical protein DEP42_06365 [Ruminococcaceae bacterium]|nr:hypothetical protein [Oscillospiraceae bacterium]